MVFLIALVVLIILAIWIIIDFFQIFTQGVGQIGAIIFKILLAIGLCIYVVFHYLHKIKF